ncbi:MAG: hypothetical protein KGM99_00480 [Burkholderiales bacterium]|nr:hypothetical protein [Burkholderiales bacterium]
MLCLWILIATFIGARFWLNNPDDFPTLPQSVALWLVDMYGAQNADEIADLEIWLALSVSFCIVLLTTWGARRLWRRLRHAA